MALTVTIAGTARKVDTDTLQVIDQLNDQPNEATFECFGFVPALADTVVIDDGTELLDGYIQRITEYHARLNERVRYRVKCTDQTYDLNRTLFCGHYAASTVGAVVGAIDNPTGWSSDLSAGASGVVVALLDAGLETRTSVLSRLMTTAGCWWDIDRTSKKIYGRLMSETRGTGPTISAAETDWWDFSYTQDLSQIRTDVYCYAETVVLLGYDTGSTYGAIERADYALFSGGAGAIVNNNDDVSVTQVGAGVTTSETVKTAAAAGATTIILSGYPAAPGVGTTTWVRINGQVIFGTVNTSGADACLSSVPASGSGCITADLPVGAVVEWLAWVALSNVSTSPPVPVPGSMRLYRQRIVSPAGSYGVHEFLVQDGSYSFAEAATRAESERDNWKDPYISGRVTTTDTTAIAGYSLTIDVFGISATYRIDRVTSTWDRSRGKFVHVVEFSPKRRDLVSLLLTR